MIKKLADEEFRKAGWGPSYAFILMAVKEEPGIRPTQLSQTVELEPSTVTRLVDKLISKNLIRKEISGKQASLFTTDEGEKAYHEIKRAWQSFFLRYKQILGEEMASSLTNDVYLATQKLKESVKT
jgi:DNA-binding MarR family transcriptional regulator